VWYGRSITSSGTPVPDREIEAKSSGNGPVITYRLSPEELERVRRGERLERKEEQNVATTTAPDKAEVLRRLAAGKSVSKIETEMGLGKGVLHYWLQKWGLKGIKGEQAQQLLDEIQIDQSAVHKAELAADPERPTDIPGSAEIVQGLKNHELIEQLKKELAEKTAEVERLKTANAQAVALAGQTAEKHLAEIEQLKKTVAQLEEENKYWMGQAEGLGHEADRLREERDALLQTVERAVDTNSPVRIELMHVIESAVIGLTGIEAYCTGAAIQHLWNWKGVEDLRTARWCLDQLIREREAEAQYVQAQCAQ